MKRPKTKAQRGFTLIELMVAVAIISILAAIAYPSYREYVNRGNRSEGQALLSDAAAAQERYYAQNFV
ncbi:prepilin-type N-terminal cleavage/methylation domain-containing protein, partial [Escherichia coli]|uniref:prepilin-type N-terminal cleavage/methylation domain-containing protein n=1 Tax=Escherichia coli TaxID=562 RepID=UPI00128F1356|nr:prepilin-type N-terminal cleavage/methylation domain-containing protein [Escherichia coli]